MKPLGVELRVRISPAIAVDANLPYVEIPPDSTKTTGDCKFPYLQGGYTSNRQE